jgi:hypothetical protein
MTIERPMFPPRAESVDSLSPQAAIGQRESETLASESCKPVKGLSRRLLLGGVASAAALPIAVALPVAAPGMLGNDPIFAIIEHHEALAAAYDVAVNHPGVGNDEPEFAAVNEISDQACTAMIDQSDLMFAFQPTTPLGVVALLRYIATLEDWQMPRGMGGEPDELAGLKALCLTMANALGKAVA